jgi:hypothetical protein
MRTLSICARSMFVMAALVVSTSAAAQAQYQFIKIHVPGSLGTWATGIEYDSEDEEVVGYYTTGSSTSPEYHGFRKRLHPAHLYYPLDDPFSDGYTVFLGIGGATPVGYYQTSTGASQGFFLDAFWTDVNVSGYSNTKVTGANESAEIVGVCWSASTTDYAWYQIFPNDAVVLSVPGSARAGASAVNNSGQIAGYYTETADGPGHGFLRDTNNTYTTFDYPGADATGVTGINDAGVIVGTYYRGGRNHGFMWASGVYTTIDYPHAENTMLGQIGANGWFVGSYDTHEGKTFGFLAVPTGASMPAESEE